MRNHPLTSSLLASLMLFVIALSGCRGLLHHCCHPPFRAVTESHVTMYNSPVEDPGPLAEMCVVRNQTGECGKIALIDVDGLLINAPFSGFGSLGENPVSVFRERLEQVAADPCYRAVVLRINSPGGGVTASDIMWRDLQTFRSRTGLPVVACVMDVGTGGAYYLSLAADHVMAHPTSIVGGIGVILNLYNLEEMLFNLNIFSTPIKAGEFIDIGSPLKPIDADSEEILQEIANRYHQRFCDIVRTTRPGSESNGNQLFDGRIMLADDALQAQLVDSIGYLDDAVSLARQLGCAPGAPVVMLHRCNDRARTPYAVSPNTPIQGGFLPLSVPGLERSQLPTFLYLWQPEPTLARRATGK